MSDSQLSTEHPVFPPTKDPGTEAETPRYEIAPEAEETSPAGKIQIGGKLYTPEEIEEAVRGQMRQDDYTRKTQELARMRRELEEQRERTLAEVESSASGDDPWSEVEEISPGLKKILASQDSMLKQINQAIESQSTRAAREAEADAAVRAALASIAEKPGYDARATLEFCRDHGLDLVNHPEHAEVAYRALNGYNLGRTMGEQAAVARGADVPAPMGAGPTSVSPDLTHPYRHPGDQCTKYNYRRL